MFKAVCMLIERATPSNVNALCVKCSFVWHLICKNRIMILPKISSLLFSDSHWKCKTFKFQCLIPSSSMWCHHSKKVKFVCWVDCNSVWHQICKNRINDTAEYKFTVTFTYPAKVPYLQSKMPHSKFKLMLSSIPASEVLPINIVWLTVTWFGVIIMRWG